MLELDVNGTLILVEMVLVFMEKICKGKVNLEEQ